MRGTDRYADNGNGSGFTMGILCGAAIGATLALLFAPKAGSDLRRDVAGASDRLKRRAKQMYDGAAGTMDDLSQRGAQVVDDLSRRGVEAIDDLASRGADALDQGREVVEKAGARARSHMRTERGDSM